MLLFMNFTIPLEVSRVTETLETAGFEAFLVGGCVRDLIRGAKPKDWDVTTNATPEEILALFPHTFYENNFGTVGVVSDGTEDPTLKTIEVTPYRIESEYSDNRRPDAVTFSKNLTDDLKRRDFTINALAYSVSQGQLVDVFNGQADITAQTIRTVGEPSDRLTEDALRIMRAVRFHVELGFTLSRETEEAILKHGHLLEKISKERIRDEFSKILMSQQPMNGLLILKKLNLLQYIVPELEKTIGVNFILDFNFNDGI
jgi:tRNA nucleotidyltransferase/poly(A) polymerase